MVDTLLSGFFDLLVMALRSGFFDIFVPLAFAFGILSLGFGLIRLIWEH